MTMDTQSDPEYPYQRVGHRYITAVQEAGASVLLLPITEDSRQLNRLLDSIDGLLFPGGPDISPRLYGEESKGAEGVNEPTDQFQIALARAALSRDLPVLAICRGAQILNVAMGGTLIQDISAETNSPVDHRQHASRDTCVHQVQITAGSRLSKLLAEMAFEVNSFHHQAIDKTGEGLKVVARSRRDDVVEAIESDCHRFVVGVQFHPEEICTSVRPAGRLIDALVEASSETLRGSYA